MLCVLGQKLMGPMGGVMRQHHGGKVGAFVQKFAVSQIPTKTQGNRLSLMQRLHLFQIGKWKPTVTFSNVVKKVSVVKVCRHQVVRS